MLFHMKDHKAAVLENDLNKLQKDIKSLRDRNSLLEKDIEDLNGGIDGIEESARSELGYVREGESFIRVTDKSGY